MLLGVFGTALLYGDGLITPAISVLSAVEGFEVAVVGVRRPASSRSPCVILVGLFVVQRRGTGAVGKVFGPVMVVWFAVLGVLGLAPDRRAPRRCSRRSTRSHIVDFFAGRAGQGVPRARQHLPGRHRRRGALRRHGPLRPPADHAGLVRDRAARRCCSTTSGRRALLHRRPRGDREPVLPDGARRGRVTPLAILATMASVIASQALISGAFSLTVQAVQLDYLPRVAIRAHVRRAPRARCTCPLVNWALMVGCVGLVLGFQILEQPRRRLRHRGHHHDGDHHDPVLRGRPRPLGLVARQGRRSSWRRCSWSTSRSSPPTSRRSPHGGWFPLARRRRAARADGDVAQGPASSWRPASGGASAPSTRCSTSTPTLAARGRHRGVPVQGPGQGAAGAGQQPAPQQGAARDDAARRRSSPTDVPAWSPTATGRGRSSVAAGRVPGRRCGSASWRSPTCPRRWPPSTSRLAARPRRRHLLRRAGVGAARATSGHAPRPRAPVHAAAPRRGQRQPVLQPAPRPCVRGRCQVEI